MQRTKTLALFAVAISAGVIPVTIARKPKTNTNNNEPQEPSSYEPQKRAVPESEAQQYVANNFYSTIQFQPGPKSTLVQTIPQIETTVSDAITNNERIKVYGSGWSWTTQIANDGDTYLKLDGPFLLPDPVDISNRTVVVGAGVKVFDLYQHLIPSNLQIDAHGACLTSYSSQTVGGVLATNVHHSGIRTFYDVAEWVEVVTTNGGSEGLLVRTHRGEDLFRATVGGGGRTGIIVRAKFSLSPRLSYRSAGDVEPYSDNSFAAYLGEFPEMMEGRDVMTYIPLGTRGPIGGIAYKSAIEATETYMDGETYDLPPDWGAKDSNYDWVQDLDPLYDAIFSPDAYNGWLLLALVITSDPTTGPGEPYMSLDAACSSNGIVTLAHAEVEWFIPVSIATEVGEWMDGYFASASAIDPDASFLDDHGLWTLRYVPGCDSLTAANGIMADGETVEDVISVNIDLYQKKYFNLFHKQVYLLSEAMNEAFPGKVRAHPGKYNPPVAAESEEVGDIIEYFDPSGVFGREVFNRDAIVRYS